MQSRVVLFFEGSPAAGIVAGLPPEFDRRSVRPGAAPALAPTEEAALIVDADSDPPGPVVAGAAKVPSR